MPKALTKAERAAIVDRSNAAAARGDQVTAQNLLQKLVDAAPRPKVKKR